MLQGPKKSKFRKQRKGDVPSHVKGNSYLAYGEIGLKSMIGFRITARQIEAARKAAVRQMERAGKFWIRVFPDIAVTQKSVGTRMGSGKAAVDHYIARIAPGQILFEITGVADDRATEALRLAASKLPCATRTVRLVDNSKVENING